MNLQIQLLLSSRKNINFRQHRREFSQNYPKFKYKLRLTYTKIVQKNLK